MTPNVYTLEVRSAELPDDDCGGVMLVVKFESEDAVVLQALGNLISVVGFQAMKENQKNEPSKPEPNTDPRGELALHSDPDSGLYDRPEPVELPIRAERNPHSDPEPEFSQHDIGPSHDRTDDRE